MKTEVYLEDLAPYIGNFLVKLEVNFLRDLMVSSSKSNKPWANQKFVEYIGYTFNKNEGCSTALVAVYREGRALHLSVIQRMLELSTFNWKDVEKSIISLRAGRRGGNVRINFPIFVDSNLGSIVGHIIGDGSIDKRFHSLFFSNSNTELLKEFKDYTKKIFGIEPRIWVQKKAIFGKTEWLKKVQTIKEVPNGHNVGLFYPKICSDVLHVLFDKFAEGKNKKVTNQIKNSNLEFKKGLVRSFFDDEGSVRADSHTIRFHQDNKELLEEIRLLIKELGINPHEIKSYLKRNKLRYYFNINGFKEYYRFYHLIGCTSSKKKKEFELLIDKVKNSKYFRKKFAL